MIFNSEITDSGPHLSDAARHAGPARQCTVAAWLPRTACLARALRPLSGQRAALPDSPALAHAPTVPRLALRRPRPWAAHAGRASAASTGRAPHRRGPCALMAAGRAHAVRLGRARFRPSGTRLIFFIFYDVFNSFQIQKFV
jgi:hypothetical protein